MLRALEAELPSVLARKFPSSSYILLALNDGKKIGVHAYLKGIRMDTGGASEHAFASSDEFLFALKRMLRNRRLLVLALMVVTDVAYPLGRLHLRDVLDLDPSAFGATEAYVNFLPPAGTDQDEMLDHWVTIWFRNGQCTMYTATTDSTTSHYWKHSWTDAFQQSSPPPRVLEFMAARQTLCEGSACCMPSPRHLLPPLGVFASPPAWDSVCPARIHLASWLRVCWEQPDRRALAGGVRGGDGANPNPTDTRSAHISYVDGGWADMVQKLQSDGGQDVTWYQFRHSHLRHRVGTMDEALSHALRKPVACVTLRPVVEVVRVPRDARSELDQLLDLGTLPGIAHASTDLPGFWGCTLRACAGSLTMQKSTAPLGAAYTPVDEAGALAATKAAGLPHGHGSRVKVVLPEEAWSLHAFEGHRERMLRVRWQLMAAAWAPARHVDWCLDQNERRELQCLN